MKKRIVAMLLGTSALLLTTSIAWAEQNIPEHCGLYAYKAEVSAVYDGDTITANVDLGFNTWRRGEKLRLFGIDAPEVRGDSREAGLKSRDVLRERILGKEVIVCTIKDKTGKYGRYLAEIFLDGQNVNQWLVKEGYAVAYEGAVKAGTFSWSDFFGDRFEYAPLPKPENG